MVLILIFSFASAESAHGLKVNAKVKQSSDQIASKNVGEKANDEADIVYDERQTDGETNIRLHVKNFQIQVPESSLAMLKGNTMTTMIRNSILKLFGIPFDESELSATQEEQVLSEQEQQQQSAADSMLQINGNNLPAKFFLEISDFLMNNQDNDAVDDQRVETNHRKNAENYATEEIKIERLENVNNVKNETITISKKLYTNGPQNATNQTVFESTNTENKFSNNVTHNHTEKEDRYQKTRPIRLDTVMMMVKPGADGKPATLREKVIWRVEDRN
ncbi:uncharacterized protein LOC128740333 [Sabethes cyaneus]|uniref:uncharacterized protein LOC128740333 n=1 Tax=Sabethes cyaneus TaxID=53552 RepID=UPI00237EA516|nr:uncharacterized protein LOC128740333 [Sabethes cyaneus]